MKFVCIDFDGTIVEHRYPKIGSLVPFAIDVMRELLEAGVGLILYTMRCGDELTEAVEFLKAHNISFIGVNENPYQTWSNSRKVYAHAYIDDSNIDATLNRDFDGLRMVVDWLIIRRKLVERGFLER